MRLLKNHISVKDQSGFVKLLPEDPEDMWHAYNLIQPGDIVSSTTLRKVRMENELGSATNAVSTKSKVVVMKLIGKVQTLDFDPKASTLRVKVKVEEDSEAVGAGQFHTFQLELNRDFTLQKSEGWDSVALDMLRDAISIAAQSQTYVALMVPGEANIYRVTENRTVFAHTVKSTIPGKGAGSAAGDAALRKFNSSVLSNILRLQEIDSPTSKTEPQPLLVGSPGFTAQNFLQYMKDSVASVANKPLSELIKKTVVTHVSSTSPAALAEVLSSKAVAAQMTNARFTRESVLLDQMYESLRKDDGRAWYGPKEVEQCVEKGAVSGGSGTLLISNKLFRSNDIGERRRWVILVDKVKAAGAEVRVLSDVHESGRRLDALGGVAALLSFPIYELEDDEEDDAE